MEKIIIKEVPPYDGEYELDIGSLKNRDWSTIKRLSGVRPLELVNALKASDADVIVAFAVIALQRSGKFPYIDEDVLWDAESGEIRLVLGDEGADASPPDLTHAGAPDSPASESESAASSGRDSSGSSAN